MSPDQCPGPLVWFDVPEDDQHDPAAILECGACDYLIVTGTFHDARHATTPLVREGMATA